MGMKFKYSHYAFAPVDRSDLLEIVNALESAINVGDPSQDVTITVNGNKDTTVRLSSEKLTELVEIMKIAFNED